MRWALIMSVIFLAACGSDDKKEQETIIYEISDSILAWQIDVDSMIMKRDVAVPDSSITINRIINGLNEKYPHVNLIFIKQSGDTVFTKVPQADYLGNQMGDAGVAAWYADAVINLTSVPRVNYVSFDIPLQSHVSSDVIGKDRYNNWVRR